MPGISFIGTAPKKEKSKVAQVLEGVTAGVKAWQTGQKETRKAGIKEREISLLESAQELKGKKLEHDYAKLDYDKRKDMYDTMTKLLPSIPENKQLEITSTPEWMKLEESLGMPHLSGTTLRDEKEPSWGQEQETSSMRADLVRGRGSISTLVGEPIDFPIDSMDAALDYISKKKRDPSEFAEELKRYETNGGGGVGRARVIERRKAPNGDILEKYSDGRIINKTTGREVR